MGTGHSEGVFGRIGHGREKNMDGWNPFVLFSRLVFELAVF